ncbi:MAG: type VI secretion system-associated protein TagF [Methylovirgula sp.]
MNIQAPAGAAGLFGKLPSSRDFLRRGLPNRFVLPWDNWLAHVIKASQEALGESWMQAYLMSPPWCFALDPHVLDDNGWLGIVVSSVDALHRCFPLTLAAECSAQFADFWPVFDCDTWMQQVETLALALIDGNADVDQAVLDLARRAKEIQDAAAARLPLPAQTFAEARWSRAYDLIQAPLAAAASGALSYWWHDEWPAHAAIALRCCGLPRANASTSFFDAGWLPRGLVERPL